MMNKELRKFGIIFGIAMIVLGTFQLLKGHSAIYPWLYGIGVFSFLSGLFFPRAIKPVHIALKTIFRLAEWVITRTALIIVFYFIITPIRFIAGLSGKEFLDINWNKKSDTYWIKKEKPSDTTERYEKQF
ncbi:MAG: hypothetical protein JW946_06115 [Candidatus Omnitrophica bacterium]|nr:hypothetical protein [Candidatus Omnitrophota bacterium]